MINNEIKTTLDSYFKELGQVLTDQELTDSANNLLSFFEILIEADKKLMKANDSQTQRDSDNPD